MPSISHFIPMLLAYFTFPFVYFAVWTLLSVHCDWTLYLVEWFLKLFVSIYTVSQKKQSKLFSS